MVPRTKGSSKLKIMSSSSSSSSSSQDEEYTISTVLLCTLADSDRTERKRVGGSRPGKQGNRDIQRPQGARRLDEDYFCRIHPGEPIFNAAEFERRFTVTQSIYERIMSQICDHDSYFVQRKDCCGVAGATPDQKICAALRILSSGVSADSLVDYFRLSESTLMLTFKLFCTSIRELYEGTYLRRPTLSDLQNVESQYSKLGFPACIGCVDCSGWEWENCPVALQGQYIGKDGKPTIRMEVVCDDMLWVWHLMFGVPGSKNDKSVLNQSTLFNDIRTGNWPRFKPNINVGGTLIDWFYYLSDGIYPRFRIFAKPHPDARTPKERWYNAAHASARKGVERVFGVLDGQFEILKRPARLAHLFELSDVVHACVILHNMIVEERGYEGTAKFRIEENMRQTVPTSIESVQRRAHCSYEQAQLWRDMLDPLESIDDHVKLQGALMQNIWNAHGDNTE